MNTPNQLAFICNKSYAQNLAKSMIAIDAAGSTSWASNLISTGVFLVPCADYKRDELAEPSDFIRDMLTFSLSACSEPHRWKKYLLYINLMR